MLSFHVKFVQTDRRTDRQWDGQMDRQTDNGKTICTNAPTPLPFQYGGIKITKYSSI